MLPNKRNPKAFGKVITFYSYKGGVGRSFILANVASQLALWGFRVLCVDWDLEAPGLTDYFLEELDSDIFRDTDGIVELMLEYQDGDITMPDWKRTVIEIPLTHRTIQGIESSLHIISAGRNSPSSEYIENVHKLDWDMLYVQHNFAYKLDDLKKSWKEEYDIVFLDSRTGISDVSGICTVQLPDILALVLTPNKQSMDGILQVAKRAVKSHASFPLSDEKLLTIPIVSRLDQRDETTIAESWLARINKTLAPLYDSWLNKNIPVQRIQEFTKVPYITRWSFGETLAVLRERGSDSEQISYSFQSLAALLAEGIERTDEFTRSRDEFIKRLANYKENNNDIEVTDPLARRLLESRSASAIAAYAETLQSSEENLDDADALWIRAIQLEPNNQEILKGFAYFINRKMKYLNGLLNSISQHQERKLIEKQITEANTRLKSIEPKILKIFSDRLPTVKGGFFGREAELQLLDDALFGNGTRIIQFIAAGGTGKTKLLRHWLNQHTNDIPNLIAWSFYSHGAYEDKQVSATSFFLQAFKVLKAEKISFNSEEEKGSYLAELLIRHHCLLVLDGLEPLQHAGRGMRGELKERAIRQLLKSLASEHTSLCIITSQIAVFELSDRDHVVTHDLHNLTQLDGVALLRSLGVKGHYQSLGKAVREYGCHALTLHLLGNALHTYLDGDIRKRDTLPGLIGNDDHTERHAFKVMQAYSKWLADTPELKLLHLLGLFDHPIETGVLQVLWRQQIPDLTLGIAETAWKVAIRDLRDKHKLLFAHDLTTDLLDCHPLIREYFGRQLRETYPHAWQQAHASLYNHYQALPEKTQPDTLEQMQPLFHAIGHGCQAGLHQQVFDTIYWHRVSREKGYYLNKIGAAGDNLAALIHFFDKPWVIPSPNLNRQTQALLLRTAGHNLRALGRLDESIEPFSTALHLYEQLGDRKEIAITSSNLIEPKLTLGDVGGALKSAWNGVYPDDSKFIRRLENVSILARALHQAGETQKAYAHFMDAEHLQQSHDPEHPRLHSLSNFRLCELLLEQGKLAEVEERAQYALAIAQKNAHPLYIGLSQLLIGRVYLQQGNAHEAKAWLDSALNALQEAGNQDHLPRGYLARAVFYRIIGDFRCARADLQAMWEIVELNGMRLHLTNYHLEMARLLVAEEENPPQSPFCKGGSQEDTGSAVPPFEKGGLGGISLQAHIEAAAKLITTTGYHRRDAELAELQALLTN